MDYLRRTTTRMVLMDECKPRHQLSKDSDYSDRNNTKSPFDHESVDQTYRRLHEDIYTTSNPKILRFDLDLLSRNEML